MNLDAVIGVYVIAREAIRQSRFDAEINWQASLNCGAFSESQLIRECAWVILCSGFRESVVRRHFPFITTCFCDWESCEAICREAALCRVTALTVFANERKIEAILNAAAYISRVGFLDFKKHVLDDPLPALALLPFIGKVTAKHLAKNLGFDIAKPDRHLARLACFTGHAHVQDLCTQISNVTGDPVRVVDLVLWRFLEQTGSKELAKPSS